VRLFHPLILEHSSIHPHIVALDLQRRFGRQGINDKVIVTVGTIFITVVPILGVFSKRLSAFLADERHVETLHERVVFCLGVALGTVEPFPATG